MLLIFVSALRYYLLQIDTYTKNTYLNNRLNFVGNRLELLTCLIIINLESSFLVLYSYIVKCNVFKCNLESTLRISNILPRWLHNNLMLILDFIQQIKTRAIWQFICQKKKTSEQIQDKTIEMFAQQAAESKDWSLATLDWLKSLFYCFCLQRHLIIM